MEERSSGSKKRRSNGEGAQGLHAAAAAAAEDEDSISALPEELRLRILCLLPLKPAIRTGALSSRWRGLWERRWPPPSSLDLVLSYRDSAEQLLESLERRGRRRLDRFSLAFDWICPGVLGRFVDYAAACGVEDLRIHARLWVFNSIRFSPCSPALARLSLRGVAVNHSFLRALDRSDPLSALEVVHIHSVRMGMFDSDLTALVRACPRLRVLDMRYCSISGDVDLTPAGPHLRSLTVANCHDVTRLRAGRASGLRSFCFTSDSLPTLSIPATVSLDDLYISLRGAKAQQPDEHFLRVLPSLANLTVLTICSFVLRRVFALVRVGSVTRLAKLNSLPSLKELQLLMFAMDGVNLARVCAFLKRCHCPQLERIFIKLPTDSKDPLLEHFIFEAEEDGPGEKTMEEAGPNDMLLEEDVSEEELSDGDMAEEELWGNAVDLSFWEYESDEEVQKYVSKKDQSEEDVPEEELCEEDVPEEELSEGVEPDEELPEEDEPEGFLNNLMLVKMTNFKLHCYELELVRFLLRKATNLKKLLLIAPKVDREEAFQVLDTPHFLYRELLHLKWTSPNTQMIFNGSDAVDIQPMHTEV